MSHFLSDLSKKDHLFDALIILFISLVITLVWFQKGMLIAHEEIGFFFVYPERMIYNSFFTWFEIDATGYANAQQLVTIPFQLLMLILETLGFSEVLRQACTLFILLVASGLSMYQLTRFLVRDKTQRVASLVSGLIYMMNPYVLLVLHRFNSIIFFAPFFPLIAFLYLKGLEDKRNVLKNAVYVNLAFILSLATFPNPAYLQTYALIFLALFLFYIIKNIKNKFECLHIVKFSAITAILGILLNLWWLLPLVHEIPNSLQSAMEIGPVTTLQEVSKSYTPGYIIRLFASYSYDWQLFKGNFLYIAITFLLPILAFSALLVKRDKPVLFFSLLALLGLFLSSGIEPPFGNIFMAIFGLTPFLAGFRDPFNKFGIILAFSYSFLVGIAISCLYSNIKHEYRNSSGLAKALIAALLILTIIPAAFPIISGAVFKPAPGEQNYLMNISYYVTIPSSYREADKWLSEQGEEYRVISLPVSNYDYLAYNWESGYYGMKLLNLWSKPMIEGQVWKNNVDFISSNIDNFLPQTGQIWKIMAILNVRYILVHEDAPYYPPWNHYNPGQYAQFLNSVMVPDYAHLTDLQLPSKSWKNAQIAEHNVTADGESIRVTSKMEGEPDWEGGIEYEWNSTEDLSNYTFFTFQIKFESVKYVKNAYFWLVDTDGNYKKWRITDDIANYSTQVLIPINSTAVWQGPNDLNLSSIKTVRITIEKQLGPMETVVWWISNFNIVPTERAEQQHINYSNTFDNLTFYKVDDNFFLPLIHATNQFALANDSKEMLNLLAFSSLDPRNETTFCRSQLTEEDIQFLNNLQLGAQQTPNVTFQEINPTEYRVDITNATGPFFLVFSSTYDDDWRISVDGESVDAKHLIANSYANAWYIDPKEIGGDKNGNFTISLYFWPQSLVYEGLTISGVTFVLIIAYLVYKWRKNRGYSRTRSIGRYLSLIFGRD